MKSYSKLNPSVTVLILMILVLASACSVSRKSGVDKPFTKLNSKEQVYQLFEEEKKYAKETQWFTDMRPEKQAKDLAYYEQVLGKLDQIDRNSLSSKDQINHEIFHFIIDDKVKRIQFEEYLMPFNAEGGFFTALTFGQRRFRFNRYRDYQSYLVMLSSFKAYMEQNMENMRMGLSKGITQPRLIAEGYHALIEPFLNARVEESFFYEPFTRIPEKISETSRMELQEDARRIIQDSVLAVYQDFDRFMKKEYLPKCRTELGLTELSQGEAYYNHLVRYFTTLDITPEEIYEIGEQEVARIEAEMQSVIAETGFTGSFSAFLNFLRTDEQFYPKDAEDLLMHAAYISKRIDGLLPNYFYHLPRLPYGVQPVPEDIAPNYTSGRYSPGSVSAHRSGNYWVNTYKLESRPLYVLPALTLHEAVPGHHLQISLAQEMEDTPDFRKSIYLSSYGEGWALYCEWLGQEMGIYRTPYERFGRLSYEMWRACRLVVDVGLHAKGWSKEQAVEYMSSRTALSMHEVNTEIDRYIGWPGQALSYKMGELKIRELRKKARKEIGSKFDLREFHDLILSNGSVPLFTLERMVEEYILKNSVREGGN